MKNMLLILLFTTQLLAQNKTEAIKNLYPHQYFTSNDYVVNDSIALLYDTNKQAVIIGLRKKIEIKNLKDSIVKRIFFLYKVEGNTLKLIFKNDNLLPDLTYGQRSNVGYGKMNAKKDGFSFKVMVLAFGSNKEYDVKYIFKFSSNKKWILSNCEVSTFYPFEERAPKHGILSSKEFGDIEAKQFNIYDFKPFSYLK